MKKTPRLCLRLEGVVVVVVVVVVAVAVVGGGGGGAEEEEEEEEAKRRKEKLFQSRKVLCKKAVNFIRSKQRIMMFNTHAYYSGLLYLIIPLMIDCDCFCDLFPIAFWSVFNLQRSTQL